MRGLQSFTDLEHNFLLIPVRRGPAKLRLDALEAGSANPDVGSIFMFRIICVAIATAFAWIHLRKSIPMIANARKTEFAVIVGPILAILVPLPPFKWRISPACCIRSPPLRVRLEFPQIPHEDLRSIRPQLYENLLKLGYLARSVSAANEGTGRAPAGQGARRGNRPGSRRYDFRLPVRNATTAWILPMSAQAPESPNRRPA